MQIINQYSNLDDLSKMDDISVRKRFIKELIFSLTEYNYIQKPYERLQQDMGFEITQRFLISKLEPVLLGRNMFENNRVFAEAILDVFHVALKELISKHLPNGMYSLSCYDDYIDELLDDVEVRLNQYNSFTANHNSISGFDYSVVFEKQYYTVVSIENVLKTDLDNVEKLDDGLFLGTLYNYENIIFDIKGKILLSGTYDYETGLMCSNDKKYRISNGRIVEAI